MLRRMLLSLSEVRCQGRGLAGPLGTAHSSLVLERSGGLDPVPFLLQPSVCQGAMSSTGFVTSQGNASKFAKVASFFFLLSFYT